MKDIQIFSNFKCKQSHSKEIHSIPSKEFQTPIGGDQNSMKRKKNTVISTFWTTFCLSYSIVSAKFQKISKKEREWITLFLQTKNNFKEKKKRIQCKTRKLKSTIGHSERLLFVENFQKVVTEKNVINNIVQGISKFILFPNLRSIEIKYFSKIFICPCFQQW